jgi:hypothetical protein
MKMNFRLLAIPALLLIAIALLLLAPQFATTANSAYPNVVKNKVLAHALDVELGRVKPAKWEQHVSSGVLYSLLQATGELDRRASAVKNAPSPKLPSALNTQGCQNVFSALGLPDNIRVNQDCSLRRQAEEVVVANPTNPKNLIAGQNDSRIGYNHCGYDFSFDSGRTWGDQIPPFYGVVNLDGVVFDACSDPTATFDSAGNAYIGGVFFEIFFADSAFLVQKSNAPIGGAFFHSPDSTLGSFQTYSNGVGVVANDNDPNIAHDKEFIVADANSHSPKANNVYATWTRFNAKTGAGVGGDSPIYFSQSTDGGRTWSTGVEISGANATYCTAFSGQSNPNACDQDQGSDPIVGADGTVYVTFGNGNTPSVGLNQYFLVRCPAIGGNPATTDCSNKTNWSTPVKISDMYSMEPSGPVASSGCPAGRQCLPPNGYRMDPFTYGAVSIATNGNLFFSWSDFRNGAANCNPNGSAATAVPPCNEDVFYTFSTNGGASWNSTIGLTNIPHFGNTAQYMPWSAVKPDGSTLYVSFYDRSIGSCEFTGCNDIMLATVSNPAGNRSVSFKRITTSSMPNLVPSNNPYQAGFNGDYMWTTVDVTGKPYVIWADNRGLNGSVEEDIYIAAP